MTHLFPGDAKPMPLPMREVGAEWVGELHTAKDIGEMPVGTLVQSISVDRYTLRFSMFSKMAQALGSPPVIVGQCKRLEKQL